MLEGNEVGRDHLDRPPSIPKRDIPPVDVQVGQVFSELLYGLSPGELRMLGSGVLHLRPQGHGELTEQG